MALDQSALTDLLDALRSGGDMDVFRDAMQLVLQALIDLEATEAIGAARYERGASLNQAGALFAVLPTALLSARLEFAARERAKTLAVPMNPASLIPKN